MKEKIEIIKKIIGQSLPMCSLIQVGSSTTYEKYNDIDFMIICNDSYNAKDILKKIFNSYSISEIDDSIKILDYFDTEISFALYNYNEILNIIKEYNLGHHITAEHKSWTIGYWLIEGLINDLKKGNVIIDRHELSTLKKVILKENIYGEQRILKDCLEEIKIKSQLLEKYRSSVEEKFLKQDIFLSTIRAFSIIEQKALCGFKNLNNSISLLTTEKRTVLNKLYESNNIKKTIEIIEQSINKLNNLYLGTWQLGGQFKNLSNDEVIKILNCSKKMGIYKFDTALVYGDGMVEKQISEVIDDNDIILTKVPAKKKPNLSEICKLEDYYSKTYIADCVNKSIDNLKVKKINTLLLHNWHYSWDDNDEILNWLIDLKNQGIVEKIGISLPNNYNRILGEKVLCKIDVIEAPYNNENKWIEKDIDIYKKYNIEIILRSIFLQGKVLKDDSNSYVEIIKNALKFNTSVVIGMTTNEQIMNNVKTISEVKND